jgi:hypothetical protein
MSFRCHVTSIEPSIRNDEVHQRLLEQFMDSDQGLETKEFRRLVFLWAVVGVRGRQTGARSTSTSLERGRLQGGIACGRLTFDLSKVSPGSTCWNPSIVYF